MADKKNIIALEIGAQSVTMGVFARGKKGFTLVRYARRDVLLDPVEEGLRIEYVSAALADLVAELKVKGCEVRNVVSGQQVFIRFFKLPPIESDDLDQLVGYETRQQIPFSMDEIIWDYQLLPGREIGEREVLLVAIKKEHLDSINDQVETNGLQTQSVDCSITALYNAYRHSYAQEKSPVMILDIGAKTTDIIFCENQKFYTRSATVAGAFVTNSIAREMHIPFKDAEALKINSGMVSLTNGHTEGMSEQDAALAAIIRTAMTRLSTEVQRTINRYRSEYQGAAPVKAYICGGGALLACTSEFLQETLGLPVEYLNPLNNFNVGAKIDEEALAADAVSLGGVAGAALKAVGQSEFTIDLVPTSVARERTEKQLLPKVAAAGAIALAGAAVFALLSHQALQDVLEAKKPVEAQLDKMEKFSERISSLEQKLQSRGKVVDGFAALGSARFAYMDILKLLSERTASAQFWLTEFTPLINYDPSQNDLVGGLKGVSVIDRTRSANSNTADSALTEPPDDASAKGRKKKANGITAIYIEGYTLKKKEGQEYRQLISSELKTRLETDSPFTFEWLDGNQRKQLTGNQYITFIDDRSKDQKVKVPDYVDKFLMILPLKEPLALPASLESGR